MTIKLAPKVAMLLKAQVKTSNELLLKDKRTVAIGRTKTTAAEIVNDLVWMALHEGDIREYWK